MMAEAERLGRPQLGPIHIGPSAAQGGNGSGSSGQRWKRTLMLWVLVLVGLFVAGTFLVLSTVNYYFGVYKADLIDPSQVSRYVDLLKSHPTSVKAQPHDAHHAPPSVPSSSALPTPKIPRIIHQTWINETLPQKWVPVRESCDALHPSGGPDQSWEYMLWTDASSRAFIEKEYNWFLPHFDGYKYPIQRADVIRYFVLHHYGGVYMDLDIGCQKAMDPLLFFDVILPMTIPVGVSNDLIFSAPRHPFMDLVIHQLIMFDHTYGTNYPTVMFSTGPMMLSAVYGMWKRDHKHDSLWSSAVQILPQILYGKNAPEELQTYAFFTHYYGSSWHSDDSGFIMWLGRSGKWVLYMLAVVAVVGLVKEVFVRRTRVGGKWRRAAAGVISPRLGSGSGVGGGGMGFFGANHGSAGGGVSSFPFMLDGWAHTSAEVGGRFRRLKRGDLFFLPAYWMGDSSRPGSPSLLSTVGPTSIPSSPAMPSSTSSYWSWATYIPSLIYDGLAGYGIGSTGGAALNAGVGSTGKDSGGSGNVKYRLLPRSTMEMEQEEEAIALRGIAATQRAHRRGWNSSSHSGSEVDDDVHVFVPANGTGGTASTTYDGSVDDEDVERTPQSHHPHSHRRQYPRRGSDSGAHGSAFDDVLPSYTSTPTSTFGGGSGSGAASPLGKAFAKLGQLTGLSKTSLSLSSTSSLHNLDRVNQDHDVDHEAEEEEEDVEHGDVVVDMNGNMEDLSAAELGYGRSSSTRTSPLPTQLTMGSSTLAPASMSRPPMSTRWTNPNPNVAMRNGHDDRIEDETDAFLAAVEADDERSQRQRQSAPTSPVSCSSPPLLPLPHPLPHLPPSTPHRRPRS